MINNPAQIRGINIHSFRTDEWADLIGVRMVEPVGLAPRPAFECRYSDGYIDYIAISNVNEYEIK